MACTRTAVALALALCGIGCHPETKSKPPVSSDVLAIYRTELALRSVAFRGPFQLAGHEVWTSPHMYRGTARQLWNAAHKHVASTGLYPLLVRNGPVDLEDVEDLKAVASRSRAAEFNLETFLINREKLLLPIPAHKSLLASLTVGRLDTTKAPTIEAYESSALEDVTEIGIGSETRDRLTLVLVRGKPWEVAVLFVDTDVDWVPKEQTLSKMLERWNALYGVEPVFANGRFFLEVEASNMPKDEAVLRLFAREFHLTCPASREGFGVEDPAHLVARLAKPRWVCWWFEE